MSNQLQQTVQPVNKLHDRERTSQSAHLVRLPIFLRISFVIITVEPVHSKKLKTIEYFYCPGSRVNVDEIKFPSAFACKHTQQIRKLDAF